MTSELPEMRASDAERDQVAEALREAFAEGRLNTAEFEERLEAVYGARTRGELTPLVRDLPPSGTVPAGPAAPAERSPVRSGTAAWADRFGGTASSRGGVAVMSGFVRKGRWTAPRAFTCLAFWGGASIDLRQARFEDREIVIRATAVMGGVEVLVPEDAEVVVEGIGIMGGFDQSATGDGVPGAVRVRVTGFAFWGGVSVERKPLGGSGKRGREDGPGNLPGRSGHGRLHGDGGRGELG
ncbi:DUF1707 domain-containing protein [Streptomyces sp. 549]|uniref:DUF1707 SHOCT-like domain-containing protein n=1 Tax=Streptomyces sp. 549 TaxID=3049076 RepID=UPI0024C40EC7|nr:DUF1707 domain-containing protein [Streptomyces sp. 549]MDK1472062.1 DUF1707 domain-containing protein [Streptomyces sp. 549]